jgi:hypothetical protein
MRWCAAFVVVVLTLGPLFAGPSEAASVPPGFGITVTTPPLPNATVGTPYDEGLTATGGTAPYTWTVTSEAQLPPGLTIFGESIIGSPTAAGAYHFEVTVTDSSDPVRATKAVLSIIVTVPPLSITPVTLPAGTVGAPYDASLTETGGTAPFIWTVPPDQLPPGLTLTGASIVGSPTAAGTYPFSVEVTDSSNPELTETQPLSIVVGSAPPPVSITTSALVDATAGNSYGAVLTAQGGTPPYKWSVFRGSLPGGLTLNPQAGTITGAATSAGTYQFSIMATDSSSPARSGLRALSIIVAPQLAYPIHIAKGILPRGRVGKAYRANLRVSGGISPYKWSVAGGSLPAGLTLEPQAGTIVGRPSQPGTARFLIRVTDSSRPPGTAIRAVSITTSEVTPLGGLGTMVMSPVKVFTSTKGPLTFTYTAGYGGLAASGEIVITLPRGWSTPSTPPADVGFGCRGPSDASVSVRGRKIGITGVSLRPGETLALTCGIKGGRAPIAPGTPGLSTFTVSERFNATEPLTPLVTASPSVLISASTSGAIPAKTVFLLILGLCFLVGVPAAGLTAWRRHGPRRPAPPGVRAVARADLSGPVAIETRPHELTVVVRVEPHAGSATTTLEEVQA